MQFIRYALAGLVGLVLAVPGVQAQSAQTAAWPGKLIKLVVPFAAGGSTDLIARQIAQDLGERLKTSVVVDNRPGAGGTVGSDWVARQPADGSTILLGSVSTHAVAPSIYAHLPYDPARDFTPLTVVATIPNVLVVRSELPVANIKDLVARSRKPDAGFSFASNGQGTSNHLAMELLKATTGLQAVHVPYKGSGPALTDIVAGHVTSMMDVVMTAHPYIKSGKLRALAVTSSTRSAMLPEVPTVAEAGYPGFEAIVWFGLFAPPRMQPELADRLSRELIAVIQSKKMSDYLQQQGAQPSGMAPAEFSKLIHEDIAKWKKVAKSAGIGPE
jgi:tripartite-type tricarboxylate transporter receptor subunit TctC